MLCREQCLLAMKKYCVIHVSLQLVAETLKYLIGLEGVSFLLSSGCTCYIITSVTLRYVVVSDGRVPEEPRVDSPFRRPPATTPSLSLPSTTRDPEPVCARFYGQLSQHHGLQARHLPSTCISDVIVVFNAFDDNNNLPRCTVGKDLYCMCDGSACI